MRVIAFFLRGPDTTTPMQSFLISTSVVGLAEIGDKTQLLSLVLAARYRKPIPIILGVFAATLINHGASGALGAWLASVLSPGILNWAVVASFAVMAVWILVPDKLDDADAVLTKNSMGVFGTTALTFFLAEMGDKTQIVTIALAARFHEFFGVVAGTTLGMMLANVPVIYLGHKFADRLPTKAVHILAAIIFVVLGGLALRTALYPQAHPLF
ncbi:Putative manganese exporter [Paraburkholderia nemoris]|jgi:Ca2+/H+ antiporter, TMEM165/GDT1 family|uniref:GDT1 family protein n=3 Tax=Paraburkholderia TaxID=1822464 RepID=A0A1I7BSD8_9BURK|nr:putative Ca2+/H+ antiporter (TMEM165/GDT1 family) [Paraburkholderia sediminicola]CAE6702061.1 Putative manganese exporter [Paraburkholderia aspalathi]CAE6720696.1 Putative manganese exporter [Paraburkholderia nemoris]CAE6723256.1 Putative manganese exporter [Paraburkholderia nemoris]CAE6768534.1 Putative manganese exporter [Paraburkholderia nemoris]